MAGGEQGLSMPDRNVTAKVIFPVSHFRVQGCRVWLSDCSFWPAPSCFLKIFIFVTVAFIRVDQPSLLTSVLWHRLSEIILAMLCPEQSAFTFQPLLLLPSNELLRVSFTVKHSVEFLSTALCCTLDFCLWKPKGRRKEHLHLMASGYQ